MTAGYEQAVRGWAQHLVEGGETPWSRWVGDASKSAGVDGPLPAAAQLEVVRRLDGTVPDFAGLAALVLRTPAPGRGLVDVPLPWAGDAAEGARFGTPPVDPRDLPVDELVRVCVGVLVGLLSPVQAQAGPLDPEPALHRWRRPQAGLHGSPVTTSALRHELAERGVRLGGGPHARHVVIALPLEQMMAEHWARRVRTGSGIGWARMWQQVATHETLPGGVDVAARAGELAARFGAGRVHVVLGADPHEVARGVTTLLGVRPVPLFVSGEVAGADLLRRVNPVLTLSVGEERRRALADVLQQLCVRADAPRLGAPPRQLEWAVRAGERVASCLRTADYAVHGDPGLVVPGAQDAPGVRRTVDARDTLLVALRAVERAWVRIRLEREG